MSIFRLFKKYEQCYKKPDQRYYEASVEKQSEWVKEVLPRIKKIQKKSKAILYFENESCIQLSLVMGKTWGPIGKLFVQKVSAKRGSISAISAVSGSGNLLFNIHDSSHRFSTQDITVFLKKLMEEHRRRHLIMIIGRAPCHIAQKVQELISAQKKLKVFYLLPRSPEFNPAKKI